MHFRKNPQCLLLVSFSSLVQQTLLLSMKISKSRTKKFYNIGLWTQVFSSYNILMLHYNRLERLARDIYSRLIGTIHKFEENEVL